MTPLTGIIFDIRKYSVHDGPGIRTTVFFKGCPLDCWWCHNPESQSPAPEPMLRPNLCIDCGACLEVCIQGAIARQAGRLTWDRELCTRCGECTVECMAGAREMAGKTLTVADVLAQIEQDRLFYEESGGGVTISGGEPLLQGQFLSELLHACKRQELHTAVDTSGYAGWEVLERIVAVTDLFLYDLKHMDPDQHLKYTGAPLAPVLRNLERLAQRGAALWLRVPLVPGVNADEANLRRVGELAARLPTVSQVNLLAYHATAASKYQRLGLPYRLPDTPPASDDQMESAARLLRSYGLKVIIGG